MAHLQFCRFFSRSTRFTQFCTAPALNFRKSWQYFRQMLTNVLQTLPDLILKTAEAPLTFCQFSAENFVFMIIYFSWYFYFDYFLNAFSYVVFSCILTVWTFLYLRFIFRQDPLFAGLIELGIQDSSCDPIWGMGTSTPCWRTRQCPIARMAASLHVGFAGPDRITR